MNEFTNRRAGKAVTLDETVSPVQISEAQEFLGLPVGAGDPLVAGLLIAATDAVISYIGRDLLTRQWTLTHWDWPVWGTVARRNVGMPTGTFRMEIDLPYAQNAVVQSVSLYGEAETDFVNRGDAIILSGTGSGGINDSPAIVVVYDAGFGLLPADIPQAIKQAILMLASWLYEHRGACDALDGVTKSGAAFMLTPWRKAELFI